MIELLVQLATTFRSIVEFLLPIKWTVVRPGESAVRFVAGKPSSTLGVGLHFATTLSTLNKQHTHRVPLTTEEIKTFTEDGVPLAAYATVVYSVTDLPKFLQSGENPEVNVSEYAEASICETIQSLKYDDILKGDLIGEAIKEDLEFATRDMGLIVLSARLQNIEHVDPIARAKCAGGVKISDTAQFTVGLDNDAGRAG